MELSSLDTNGTGQIDVEQLRSFLQSGTHSIDKEAVERFLEARGTTEDSSLNLDELVSALCRT